MIRPRLAAIPVLLLALVGCSSPAPASAAPTSSASGAAAPEITNTVSPGLPAREICQVTENGGSYYLLVTSAADHDFTACAAASSLYSGTIDNLLALPGMDRRCILGDAYTAAHHAIVGVYSDRKAPDLAAAKAFCSTNAGTS